MLFILIFLICLALQFFFPWWIIAIISFGLAAWKAKNGKNAFFSAFLALFCLWILMSLFKSIPNENILANRVGQMLGLPGSAYNWIVVAIITGFVGGLAAGFSALAGLYCRRALGK